MRKNRCEEPAKFPHKDPIFGLDLLWKYKKSFETGQFLDTATREFDNCGKTFKANMFGSTTVKTMDSEVAKSTLATSFDNFGLEPLRYETAKNLFGNGIVVVDGSKWAHARALIQSSFDMAHIVNLASLSAHVDRLMDLIPRDGSTIDLLPLFKRLTFDTSSEFIFGDSVQSLSSSTPIVSQNFLSSFAYAQRGVGIRALLGSLKILHRDKKWYKACQDVTDFCDKNVELALARRKHQQDREKVEEAPRSEERMCLLDEMAKETQDPIDLRYQILSVFSPAHDGASIALSNVFFHLARNPSVCPHRLTPIAHLNQRVCLATTVLPTGGGLDGKSPLLIRKGDIVELNIRAMQRDKSFWGPDAEEFRPERWTSVRPMWQYIPFGGGPRVCPGMRLVWTECAFVIATMARHFSEVQNRDAEMDWIEEIRMTAQSKNGTKVALVVDTNTRDGR
ncbi:cytochrome P450 [Usnea florida]